MTCNAGAADRRRIFWTTQPDACGYRINACGEECASPGLSRVERDGGVTIANTDYVRGLALNILLTQGRLPDSECGVRPGGRGGHWQDVFRGDGLSCGTLMLNVPAKTSIRESLLLIKSYAEAALNKLVATGVATKVDVAVDYLGGAAAFVRATIYGQGTEVTNVGATVARLQNAWVWGK